MCILSAIKRFESVGVIKELPTLYDLLRLFTLFSDAGASMLQISPKTLRESVIKVKKKRKRGCWVIQHFGGSV